jgi:predicted TIM-barrel fold metal-dependent hydrolase
MWDISAFVGAWPFRFLPDAVDPEVLKNRLHQWGVTRAFVSPFEAMLHADPMPINAFWSSRLAASAFFRFVPVVNPSLPISAECLLEEVRRLPGNPSAIRLHPNYHGYTLDSDTVQNFVRKAGEAGLPVIVQIQMQDLRGMNPLLRVADTEPASVLRLALACPETAIVAAGIRWGHANTLAKSAAETPEHRLYLETSHLEFVDPIRRFIDQFGPERLLSGSHAPLLTPASLQIKQDVARLTKVERSAITLENAQKAGFR